MKGFRSTYKNEEAFRQEVLLLIILAPLGLWLGDNGVEKALLVGPLLIVLIVELLNSAIESVVDRISTENHKLSGRAKDQGSARCAGIADAGGPVLDYGAVFLSLLEQIVGEMR